MTDYEQTLTERGAAALGELHGCPHGCDECWRLAAAVIEALGIEEWGKHTSAHKPSSSARCFSFAALESVEADEAVIRAIAAWSASENEQQ